MNIYLKNKKIIIVISAILVFLSGVGIGSKGVWGKIKELEIATTTEKSQEDDSEVVANEDLSDDTSKEDSNTTKENTNKTEEEIVKEFYYNTYAVIGVNTELLNLHSEVPMEDKWADTVTGFYRLSDAVANTNIKIPEIDSLKTAYFAYMDATITYADTLNNAYKVEGFSAKDMEDEREEYLVPYNILLGELDKLEEMYNINRRYGQLISIECERLEEVIDPDKEIFPKDRFKQSTIEDRPAAAAEIAFNSVYGLGCSYESAIESVKENGFRHEEAVIAVDSLGVHWGQNAFRIAYAWRPFAEDGSRDGVYEYLKHRKYLDEDIEYALEIIFKD